MSQEIEKNADIGMIPALPILLPGLIDFIKQVVFSFLKIFCLATDHPTKILRETDRFHFIH